MAMSRLTPFGAQWLIAVCMRARNRSCEMDPAPTIPTWNLLIVNVEPWSGARLLRLR
jgi:hypothetical protein